MRKLLAALICFTLSFTLHAATTPIDVTATYTQNWIVATPNGSSGLVKPRAMLRDDIAVPAPLGGAILTFSGTALSWTNGPILGGNSSGTAGSVTLNNAAGTGSATFSPNTGAGFNTFIAPSTAGTLIGNGDTATVTNAMLAGSIADSKLNTISTALKVSNSATTATNANTNNAIVARDASGNFSATTITANLTGNASGSAGSVAVGNITGAGSGVTTFLTTPSGANLASALTTALPESKGGTNQTTYSTGDILVGGAGTLSRVSIGTQGKIPISSGTTLAYQYLNPFSAKTGNYSIVAADTNTHFQFSGGTFTGTLPTAAAGLVYIIENVDSTNALNIKTSAAGQLIDGTDCSTNAYILTKQYAKVTLMGVDGTHWSVIACNGDWVQASNGAGMSQTFATSIELVHVTLSPGEWDLSGQILFAVGTWTGNTAPVAAIATSTASISAGVTVGDNRADGPSPSAAGNTTATIASYRVVVTGSTPLYLNSQVTGSAGSGTIFGRLSARRIR